MRSSSVACWSLFATLAVSAKAEAALELGGCSDCLGQKAGAKAALVIALHGDNAPAYHRKFAEALAPAAERANVALFAPRCPKDLGCKTGSYWQWLADELYDDGWLGARIDEAIVRFDADPKRVVAIGYSGGATYLGHYAPAHPERFAAVAHVSGGAPLATSCPSIKYPVLFYIGAADPMIAPYTAPLRGFYDGCGGHEVEWRTERGVTHEGMLDRLKAGGADDVIAWLVARTTVTSPRPSASASVEVEIAPPSAAIGPSNQAVSPPAVAPSPPTARPSSRPGCTCKVGGEPSASSMSAVLLTLMVVPLAIARRLGRLARRVRRSLRHRLDLGHLLDLLRRQRRRRSSSARSRRQHEQQR